MPIGGESVESAAVRKPERQRVLDLAGIFGNPRLFMGRIAGGGNAAEARTALITATSTHLRAREA